MWVLSGGYIDMVEPLAVFTTAEQAKAAAPADDWDLASDGEWMASTGGDYSFHLYVKQVPTDPEAVKLDLLD